MSVQNKIPSLMRSSPFWVDLATAINEELLLMRQELILPQLKFFEPRTLTTFEDLRSFLSDYYGFSPYSELFYQKTLPAVHGVFPSASTSYPNRGWKGRSEYAGNGTLPYLTVTGALTGARADYASFDGGGTYLSLASALALDARRGSLIFKFAMGIDDTTKFTLASSGLTSAGYVAISKTGIFLKTDDGSAEVSIPFLSALAPTQAYTVGIRLRQNVATLYLNGVVQGSNPITYASAGILSLRYFGGAPGEVTGQSDLNGHVGDLRIFVEDLSDEDFEKDFSGLDLNSGTVRLNMIDGLKFARHEAEGLGYRIRNRGNRNFYQWVFNKARMEGRVYPLFREPATNILLKSIVKPSPGQVASLASVAPQPYFSSADDSDLKFRLDSGFTLDDGFLLDETFLGKNVKLTRHFALEMILGQTRNDYGSTGYARFTAHDLDSQVLFLQKHLDYLEKEALYGKYITEVPHIGVQLRTSCLRTDTTARVDPFTRWTTQIGVNFPGSATDWSDGAFLATLYAKVRVYSDATVLYERPILDVEIERSAQAFHILNVMIPARTIFPVTMGPGDGTDDTWSTTLSVVPVTPGSVVISYTDLNDKAQQLRDDGSGNLYFTDITPDADHFSGTINYASGALSVITILTGGDDRSMKTSTYMTLVYKTEAVLPITKVVFLNSSNQPVVTVDSGSEPKIYFWSGRNHLSLMTSVSL